MCNYNGVCPISNGCGYYQFAYCCQRRQCQPCCNRTRLLPKAAANTHDYSCLSKKCKAKNDATNMAEATNDNKENIVCPKSVTGVCKSRCVAPCSKTRKMHYPSGPLQRRRQTNSICCAAQSCPLSSTTPATCNKTENNVVEVTKTKKKSKLSKSKAKKIDSNEECACEEPKTVEDGLWFQCNVPVRVNVPNLMFMQPSINGNEINSIASGSMHSTGSNSSKSRNALSVVQRNQSQPIGTNQATPFFSVYFKQLQECNESAKNFSNRTLPNDIQTQTYLPEIPMDVPSIKSSLSPKKRICKCIKRRHKTSIPAPITSSPTTQIAEKSLSSYESAEFPLACKTYIPSVNNDYIQSPNTSQNEGNKSNQQNESSQDNTAEGDLNEMVQRDISDLHRICKCLETKKYCTKATARRSCVSLYENTNSDTSEQKQTISQSLNNLPKTCRCTTMKKETSQMTHKSTSSGNGTASPTIKSSLKLRTCEISPSSSCNSSKWQPVVQLIEDIVAESTSKSSKETNSRSASTLTTPTPSCCQSCQKCGKRRFRKKTTKTALRGGASSTDNRQYMSREHLLAALDNNECRLKDALDNRPVVLVPYQVTAAHESMPDCESKNIFTMCLATPSRRELSCSQMKCNEHKHKQADDDDNDNDDDDDEEDNDNSEREYKHETPMHTTAILMPRPLSSDSNIRPPSYSCNQPNRHEMNNYAKTVLYETTTVCSLENLIQACSRPPSNIISCGLMAKERFPDNVSQAKQMRNSNHSSLYNYQSTMDNYTNEAASVRNDCNHFNQMPAINSNNQCKMCPCCSNSCYRYGPQMMVPPASVQHIPVGVYQQTAQKYGFDIMDSFFRNQPAQANCCQMQYNQVRQNAGCYRYPTDINSKDMRSPTQRCAEPYLKRTPTQKSLALNQCPCSSNYSGHYFR